MSARLEWDASIPSLMLLNRSGGGEEVGCVRERRAGVAYDYVTYVGREAVSAPCASEQEARLCCEADARRFLVDAGVSIED